MALKTLGTNANNSLSAFVVGTDDITAAQVALLNLAIRGDPPGWNAPTGQAAPNIGTNRPRINEAYRRQGNFYIPNRGWIVLKAGDYVCVDSTTGWPFVLSADAVANGPYTHS